MRFGLSASELAAEALGRAGERIRPLLENNWLYDRARQEVDQALSGNLLKLKPLCVRGLQPRDLAHPFPGLQIAILPP